MDGPLFPDYQCRDVLLDLKPYIDKSGYDLTQLADQAVGDFTTPGGQFGLPRDLNVIALYYNKKMFDAAGIPYPDDTWDWDKLVEVGKKLTLKGSNGKVSQWGFYTETTDMENYWSLAGLAERRRHHLGRPQARASSAATRPSAACSSSRTSSTRTRSWTIPVADEGDEFEQGQAAMEANGSWLVATHLAAGIDFGIAPLPKGPAGRFTSINPTGAVVFKGTKNPDAAWEFVKYLASPAAQTKLMELKASLPANKSVLSGPFATSFAGAKVLADAIAYAHIKPSFKGFNEWTTELQNELDANVYNDPNKRRPARPSTTS